ncbi:F-box only protein 21 isoform X7 [Equus przewalskii]
MKHYSPTDYVNWLEEYKVRQKAGLEARKIVASFSKRFFSEHVPCNGFSDIENLEGPEIFFEDELVCILNMEGRKALTWKYYAKKILYYLRQQKILNNLKAFLQQPDDYESYLEGAIYIDQYCNPLSDISLKDIQAQIDSIVELVCKTLRGINSRHPSLAFKAGESSMIMEIELQSQVLDAMNYVLYDQLKFKGNRMDYYNALNLYMHQVLIRRTGIPISMSLLYLTIARQLGVPLEPVNFPSHFLLRWCQGAEGVRKKTHMELEPPGDSSLPLSPSSPLQRATLDIFDYIYIDAFGKGKQLTVKECEYLIGQHVTAALYGVVNVKKVLQRMVGNLLSLGKREGIDQSYQLLRDSLDLYLAMYPDQVQLLLLQARLYFHLGIWPEKSFCLVLKVLDILQHIQTLDPGQHGAVGYLVQHTLEHIERKKEEVGVEVKLRSHEKHRDVCYSIGLIMKHKRYGYNCVIYGWDPTCMMGHEWIRNMNVHSLPHGHHQPFYNVLVEDGSCRYAAQEMPLKGVIGSSLDKRCCRNVRFNKNVHVPLYQQKTWNIMWSLKKSRTPMSDAISQSLLAPTTSRTQSWKFDTQRIWSLSMKQYRTFTVRRKRMWSKVWSGTLDLCCCCYLPREQVPEEDVSTDPSGLTPPGKPLDQ